MTLILDVQVSREYGRLVKRGLLKRTIEETLRNEGVDRPCEVSLVITDDGGIQELNRIHRGLDEPTDVLSFPLLGGEEAGEGQVHFPPTEDGVLHLGDVVISYPHAVRQAEEQGHSLDRELAFLVVHGALHLLDYDDETADELQGMQDKAAEVMARLGENL